MSTGNETLPPKARPLDATLLELEKPEKLSDALYRENQDCLPCRLTGEYASVYTSVKKLTDILQQVLRPSLA